VSGTQLGSKGKLGLYGKVPCMGDFVVRRLNGEFVNNWDLWLQDCIANSRQLLGSSWLDQYLMAPIWRFVIGPNVLGDKAWIGIMVPSVDRVGRYFPLTLAQPINPDIDILTTYLDNTGWFQSLENIGMDALGQNINFEEYESNLSEFPAPVEIVDRDTAENTIPTLKKVFLSSYFNLPVKLEGDDTDYMSPVRNIISNSLQPTSLWGAEWFEKREHILLATENLPDKERFCSFLDQDFDAHGWSDVLKNEVAE